MSSNEQLEPRRPNEWWVGTVAGMASYIDAAAIIANGIALVIYQSALGLTPDQIGLISAALSICIAVGSFVGGRAGDRYGRRNVFMLTMLLIIAGSAINTFGDSFHVLLAGVVLLGLGVGADLPVSLASISEAASARNRGKLITLTGILWVLGILASVAVSVVVGGMGRLGGQILYGHIGAVAALVLLGRLTIPESASWLAARAERLAGVPSLRAQVTDLKDLLRPPYFKPFLALLVFYTLTSLTAGTNGFNTFIAVNLAGSTVQEFNGIALLVMIFGSVLGVFYMRVVDTPWRMKLYAFGSIMMVGAVWLITIFGFSLTTLVISLLMGTIGGTFAFEGIMKVWAQESFPTMLRSSAQGSIIGAGRIASAMLAAVTPPLLLSHGRAFYFALGAVSVIGLAHAWIVFRDQSGTEFDRESAPLPDGDSVN